MYQFIQAILSSFGGRLSALVIDIFSASAIYWVSLIVARHPELAAMLHPQEWGGYAAAAAVIVCHLVGNFFNLSQAARLRNEVFRLRQRNGDHNYRV